ncbi:MAG: hypothetical protein IPK82_31570 [Polyangiaceae bacterium]|nr:hypothetical protein [Polyangiaceae bacterium]
MLLAIVGQVAGLHYLRSVFYRMAGDLTNAEAELTREVNGLPEDDRRRAHFQEMLVKLRSKAPPPIAGG